MGWAQSQCSLVDDLADEKLQSSLDYLSKVAAAAGDMDVPDFSLVLLGVEGGAMHYHGATCVSRGIGFCFSRVLMWAGNLRVTDPHSP